MLELGVHDNVEDWCARTKDILNRQAELLDRLRRAGAAPTLFVESAAALPVLRFDASFLSILAEAGISVEYSHEID